MNCSGCWSTSSPFFWCRIHLARFSIRPQYYSQMLRSINQTARVKDQKINCVIHIHTLKQTNRETDQTEGFKRLQTHFFSTVLLVCIEEFLLIRKVLMKQFRTYFKIQSISLDKILPSFSCSIKACS